jgi:hypothetical protein
MIRRATPDDALAIATLYHHIVKKINSRDYAPTQIEAWVGEMPDEEKWRERQANRTTFVDEHDGTIRGFAELEDDGHIGAAYVHVDCQGLGIASALLDEMESGTLPWRISFSLGAMKASLVTAALFLLIAG